VWCRTWRPRPTILAALAALAIVVGCAGRTEKHTREVWENATRVGGSEVAGPGTAPGAAEPATQADHTPGWGRIDAVVEAARKAVANGADEDDIARLADRWCAQTPTPLSGPHGPVRVCVPEPPLSVDGHALTLELGAEGVIGLVASDLSDTQSRDLLRAALTHGRSWCEGPWNAVGVRGDDAHQELHTCVAPGGSTLAAGRFPTDLEADLWQVSVSIIGMC
jgi:hypothetical protein